MAKYITKPKNEKEELIHLRNKMVNVNRDYISRTEVSKIIESAVAERIDAITKKPDYFYSFSGFYIFRRWYLYNNLNAYHAELLIAMSYFRVCFKRDLTRMFLVTRQHDDCISQLIAMGYVIPVKTQGRGKGMSRGGYALTQKGKDFEKDYERFYERKMDELKTNKPTAMNKDINKRDYFRPIKIPKNIRRINQGGGELPKNQPWDERYIAREDKYWETGPDGRTPVMPGMSREEYMEKYIFPKYDKH